MAPVRYLVALALGAGAVALGLTEAAPPPATVPGPADSLGYRFPDGVKYVGNLSCASSACHAANAGGGRAGSEYTTWAGGDPHFRAYDVLMNERSRRMMAILHGPRSGPPPDAHKEKRCLDCHAPEVAAGVREPTRGVGCESCHGPADRWLTTHYQAEFKARSLHAKAEDGMYPTKDLAFRVTLCASCHVGDAAQGREVDHDLIAAGHPRLAFEYTGYHHNPRYFRHWEEPAPDFDARAWEVGQVACARSAARLLAARARDDRHVWPELSEYSCYACHQSLAERNRWKPVTAAADRKPGSMPWGTWYFSTLAERPADLRRLMENPTGDRCQVVAAADELVQRLDARLRKFQAESSQWKGRPLTAHDLAGRFARTAGSALTDDGTKFRDLDWDGVTQHYLGAAAYYHAWGAVDPAGRDTRLRRPLDDLRISLRFPKGYDSPTGTDPARVLHLFRQLQPDRHP